MTDDLHEQVRLVFQFREHANICACGNPEIFWTELLDALNHYDREDKFADLEWINDHYFMVNVLAAWDLTEHGGSVYGAWISPSGERLRNGLRAVLAAGIYWDDSEAWWKREFELHPNGRDQAAEYVSVGEWETP